MNYFLTEEDIVLGIYQFNLIWYRLIEFDEIF